MRRIVVATMALSLTLLVSGGPAEAKGPFASVLFDTFCQGLPYKERTGCNGYLQYRIERGKDRDTSINKCIWGCGQVMEDAAEVEECQTGCRKANGFDN